MSRTLTFSTSGKQDDKRVVTVSSGMVTRNRDFIGRQIQLNPSGIRTDNYRNNPVLLWMHMAGMPSIGTASVFMENGMLKARLEFHGKTEMSRLVQELWDDGFLNATSVRITLSNDDFDNIREDEELVFIASSDLVEISVVTIPADAGAHRQSLEDLYGEKFSLRTIKFVEDLFDMDIESNEVDVELTDAFDDASGDVVGDESSADISQESSSGSDIVIELDDETIEQLRESLGFSALESEIVRLSDRVDELEGETVVTSNITKARFSFGRSRQDAPSADIPKPAQVKEKTGRSKSASAFIKRSVRRS